MALDKKRKIDSECRVFQEKWTSDYFFVLVKEKPICLICKESMAVMKEYNLKRHYLTKHSKFANIDGQTRLDKVHKLKNELMVQQKTFFKRNEDAENVLRASFVVSEKIAKYSKSYSDGEFVKDCLVSVANIICPQKSNDMSSVSLSRRTVSRRINELATDVQETLISKCLSFEVFSISLDESTDVKDTAQLAIFVRGIDSNFEITEEMLAIQPMKETTTGEDIFNEVCNVFLKFQLKFEKLHGIATDGAPAMVGVHSGLIARIKTKLTELNLDTTDLCVFHCIIHEQNLCAKSLKFSDVISKVVFCINFIKSRSLNHRRFQEFLEDIEAEYGNVVYYCEVRWLSKGKMLKRFYDLRSEIHTFMDMKGVYVPELTNDKWLQQLAFLVDLTTYFNELNMKLQGQNQLVHQLYGHIKTFENKLGLWESQLKKNNLYHFSTLSNHKPENCSEFADALTLLKNNFGDRFQQFRSQELILKLFSSPFTTDVETVHEEYQMELLELQGNEELKQNFLNYSLQDFYKSLPTHFPKLRQLAKKKLCLFGSTYKCEQLFSRMKHIKCKTRSQLTDFHLENNLRLALCSIPPNIDKLVKNMQPQVSH